MQVIPALSDTILRKLFPFACAALLLSGCTTAELAIDMVKKTQKKKQVEETAVQLAEGTVVAEPRYKIGDPYTVGGVWYYPERNLTYDETGIGLSLIHI